ncbi:DUF3179 domain-containing protein [Draconibacterium sp.]|nr:DUF3179 domain-containing protein [Draconibacterium sp.]
MKRVFFLSIIFTLFVAGCSEAEMHSSSGNPLPGKPDDSEKSSEWLIPENEVRDGGPGKDGIPAIDNPKFISAGEVTYLNDDDLVLGFADGEDIRAYPHKILDWHEIVNDDTPNHSVAVIYCPLTGTGIGWDRVFGDKKTTFGVSGLLYNSNIIPYDRATDSNWSQLLLKSVNGNLKGIRPIIHNLVETSWKTWKTIYPSSKVLSLNTGYNRSYQHYPYGSYKTDGSLLFPVSNSDPRLQAKERVLTVFVNEKAKAFRFNKLGANNNLIVNEFNGRNLVVAGNKTANLMVAFDSKLPDGTKLEFQLIENQLPALLSDNEGNTWDVFGRAIEGPRKGQKLFPVDQMMGYWFAFAAFYPEIAI